MPLSVEGFPLAVCALLILWSQADEATALPYRLHSGFSATSTYTSESSVAIVPGTQGQVIIVDEDGDGEGVVLILGESATTAADRRPAHSPVISTTPIITPPLAMGDIEVNPATGHSFIRTGDRAPQLVDPRTGKPFDSSTIPSAQPSFVSGQLQPPANFPSPPIPTTADGAIGFALPPPISGAAIPPDTSTETEDTPLPLTPTEVEVEDDSIEGAELNTSTILNQAPVDEPADATSVLSDSG